MQRSRFTRRRSRRDGFTLVEVLVVVIAILAAPNVFRHVEGADVVGWE